jgi:outer membrane protein assembly factor BamB
MPYPKLFHRMSRLLLFCIVLAGCSGWGESAKFKRQAEQFAAEGRLAEAVLTYRQALASDPDNPDLLGGLGTALAAQGRNRSAAQALRRVADQKPDDEAIRKTLSELITRPQDGLSLSLSWIVSPADSEPIGAAAAAGKIFVVYAGGSLIALEQTSGQVIWNLKAPAALVSPPAADETQVWVGAEDGKIFIYDAASGGMLGSYPTDGAVYAAPALTSDLAFCPSSDGSLYALDRTDLQLVWKAAVGEAMQASPLAVGQAVYVGANDGRLYAFEASTGKRIWKNGILTQGAIESVPASAEGWIFAGSDDGRVYALDAETGGEYWRFSTPDAIYAQPLLLAGQLIVASGGQVLASIRWIDGILSWSLSFEHPITEAPVFFKERLYLVTRSDPRLFAVDPGTGEMTGELNTGDWIARGPLAAGDGLTFVGKDGSVFLYR